MYVIGRSDLAPGYQAVQGMHAGIQFIFDHPDVASQWHLNSDYLCFLSVADEKALLEMVSQANSLGLKCSVFREPDIGNQVTAIALEPNEASKRLCSRLTLALKGVKNA